MTYLYQFSYAKFWYQKGPQDKFGTQEGELVDTLELRHERGEYLKSVTVTNNNEATLWLTARTNMGKRLFVNFTEGLTPDKAVPHDISHLWQNKFETKDGYEICGIHVDRTEKETATIRGIFQRPFKRFSSEYRYQHTWSARGYARQVGADRSVDEEYIAYLQNNKEGADPQRSFRRTPAGLSGDWEMVTEPVDIQIISLAPIGAEPAQTPVLRSPMYS
eukprot:CAMPEP_0170187532 /NCGR_PEP_ID=MMETSP0040_2-20121228/41963_1 /TAXON_ID=641309 /ORGANISM="Lotharella oceanica, Strain CCMP622" /LENGTH=218 /DNA_ID=CAMNT_0010434591 /DNA_START=8 /DNA_END=664 /DNA_ORIENTATION=+